jgi:plasmid stability protein
VTKGWPKGKPRGRGNFAGHHHTEKAKQLVSAANTGRRFSLSLEAKAKIRAARLGASMSAETRSAISESLKGHEVLVETRQKISEGVKRWYEDPEHRRKHSEGQRRRHAEKKEKEREGLP